MPIVGFNFTKLNIEKTESMVGKVSITNNVRIKDVEKIDLTLGKEKKEGLKFKFEFMTDYKSDSSGEKSVGKMEFEGEVTFMDEPKVIKEAEENWKKNKKLDKAIMENVLNMALNKSNIEAIILTDKVNLPPPIPLPKVNIEGKTEK